MLSLLARPCSVLPALRTKGACQLVQRGGVCATLPPEIRPCPARRQVHWSKL